MDDSRDEGLGIHGLELELDDAIEDRSDSGSDRRESGEVDDEEAGKIDEDNEAKPSEDKLWSTGTDTEDKGGFQEQEKVLSDAAELAEKLRADLASDKSEVQVAGICRFREILKGPNGVAVILEYRKLSPLWEEVLRLWEVQQAANSMKISVVTLLLVTDLLRHPFGMVAPQFAAQPQTHERAAVVASIDVLAHAICQKHLRSKSFSSFLRRAAVVASIDVLAHAVCQKHLRPLYSHLSSAQRNRINASLILLTSMASRSKALARELISTFDFNLTALSKISAHPRQKQSGVQNMEGPLPPPSMIFNHWVRPYGEIFEGGSKLQPLPGKAPPSKQGDDYSDYLKRHPRVFFIDFALSFLVVGDSSVMKSVLQKRVLFSSILHGMAADHPIIILRILKVLNDQVMASNRRIPRGLQGALFGDSAVEQIMKISASPDDKSDTLSSAVQLAHQTLLNLFTNPSHGICPLHLASNVSYLEVTRDGEYDDQTKDVSHGERHGRGGNLGRLLRLSLRLKVTENKRHSEVLLIAAKKRPMLAGAYLNAVPFSLEPRASPRWFAASTIVSQLIKISSEIPMLTGIALFVQPPAVDSPPVRSVCKRICPPALSRTALSRGLQHQNPLVKYASVCTLVESLRALEKLLAEIYYRFLSIGKPTFSTHEEVGRTSDLVIRKGDEQISGGTATGISAINVEMGMNFDDIMGENDRSKTTLLTLRRNWADLARGVAETVRTLLPDPNTLIALNKSLENFENETLLKSTDAIDVAGSPQKIKKKVEEKEGNHSVPKGLDGNASTDQDTALRDEKREQLREDTDDLLDVMEDSDGVKKTLGELLGAQVLEALAGYQRSLSQSLADCRFDPFKLLPKDPSVLPITRQIGLTALLMAAVTPSDPSIASPPPSFDPQSLTVPSSAISSVALWTFSGPLYQHCLPLLRLFLGSEDEHVQSQARFLVWMALASTGSFDSDLAEINIWLDGLPSLRPCYTNRRNSEIVVGRSSILYEKLPKVKGEEGKPFWKDMVISFLADAILNVGKNPYKYWEDMQTALGIHNGATDDSLLDSSTNVSEQDADETALPVVSPLVICALTNSMRVARSTSRSLGVSERAAIVSYTANVLKLLLLVQPEPSSLARLIWAVLHSEPRVMAASISSQSLPTTFECEWAPLHSLLLRVETVLGRPVTLKTVANNQETTELQEPVKTKKTKRKARQLQNRLSDIEEVYPQTEEQLKQQKSSLEAVLDTMMTVKDQEVSASSAAENALFAFSPEVLGSKLMKITEVLFQVLGRDMSVLAFLLNTHIGLLGSQPGVVEQVLDLIANEDEVSYQNCEAHKRGEQGGEEKMGRKAKKRKTEHQQGEEDRDYTMSGSEGEGKGLGASNLTGEDVSTILASLVKMFSFNRLLAEAVNKKDGKLLALRPMRELLVNAITLCGEEKKVRGASYMKKVLRNSSEGACHSVLEVANRSNAARAILSAIRQTLNRWRFHEGDSVAFAKKDKVLKVELPSLRQLAMLYSVLEVVVLGETKENGDVKEAVNGEGPLSWFLGIFIHPVVHNGCMQWESSRNLETQDGSGKEIGNIGVVKNAAKARFDKGSMDMGAGPAFQREELKQNILGREVKTVERMISRNKVYTPLTSVDWTWSLCTRKFILRVLSREGRNAKLVEACRMFSHQAADRLLHRLRSWSSSEGLRQDLNRIGKPNKIAKKLRGKGGKKLGWPELANIFVDAPFMADECDLSVFFMEEGISLWLDAMLASYSDLAVVTSLLMEILPEHGQPLMDGQVMDKHSRGFVLSVSLFLAKSLFSRMVHSSEDINCVAVEDQCGAEQRTYGTEAEKGGGERNGENELKGREGVCLSAPFIVKETQDLLEITAGQNQRGINRETSTPQKLLCIYQRISHLALEQMSPQADDFLLFTLKASCNFNNNMKKLSPGSVRGSTKFNSASAFQFFPLILTDQEDIPAFRCLPNLASAIQLELIHLFCQEPSSVRGAVLALLADSDFVHRNELEKQLFTLSQSYNEETNGHGVGVDASFSTNGKANVPRSESRSNLSGLLPAVDVYLSHHIYELENHTAEIDQLMPRSIARFGRTAGLKLLLEDSSTSTSASSTDLYNALSVFRKSLVISPLTRQEQKSVVRTIVPKAGWPLLELETGLTENGVTDRIEVYEKILAQAFAAHTVVIGVDARITVNPEDEEGQEKMESSKKTKNKGSHLLRYIGGLMNTLLAIYRSKGTSIKSEDTEALQNASMPLSERGIELLAKEGLEELEEGLLEILIDAVQKVGYQILSDSYLTAMKTFVIGSLKYAFAQPKPMEAVRALTSATLKMVETSHDDNGQDKSQNSNTSEGDSVAYKVARLGQELFQLLVSHSQFSEVLLATPRGSERSLPDVMGRSAGNDERWGTLTSICSLIDTPMEPSPMEIVGFGKSSQSPERNHATAGEKKRETPHSSSAGLNSSENKGHVLRVKEYLHNIIRHEQDKTLHDWIERHVGMTVRQTHEIVKLLHVFLQMRLKHMVGFAALDEDRDDVSFDHVLSLLMASYGGTMTDLDCWIFAVIRLMETCGGAGYRGMSGMDYLWGEGAIKRMREINPGGNTRMEDKALGGGEESGAFRPDNEVGNADVASYRTPNDIAEARRRRYREELSMDPRRCGLTALSFAGIGKKHTSGGSEEADQSTGALHIENSREKVSLLGSSAYQEMELREAAYNPAFFLPMALHVLNRDCLNLRDFARLGLLPVACASLCSSDESLRRLGYEILGKYGSALEASSSFKEKPQLELLLRYIRNAVEEPFQRLPAISVIFAAEAACIVVHSESLHYAAVNKALLYRPALDLEDIPMFFQTFKSGAMHTYRAERTWMLRQLAAGLATSTDAIIFRRRFVMELLMSFCDCPLTDAYTRKLFLQVIRKGAEIPHCAYDMVENTGLMPWLGRAVASATSSVGWGVQKEGKEMVESAAMAVEIIELLLLVPSIQKRALGEGFIDLCHCTLLLNSLLVNPSTPSTFLTILRRPVLRILGTTLEISKHRHSGTFTCKLSSQELLEVVHWVEKEALENQKSMASLETQALCLQVLLKSGSPRLSERSGIEGVLLRLGLWAVSSAIEIPDFGLWDKRLGLFPLAFSDQSASEEERKSHKELVLHWVSTTLCNAGLREIKEIKAHGDKFLLSNPSRFISLFSSSGQIPSPHQNHGSKVDTTTYYDSHCCFSDREVFSMKRLLAKGLLSLHSKMDIVGKKRCIKPLIDVLKFLDPDPLTN